MNCSGDVSESELANVVMEIQEVTSKMAPKSHAQPQEKRQPKFTSQQLHVVLVIDASLSMGIEDTNLLMDRKGSDDSDVKLQTTVRRIDAVFHSCQSFLEVCQPESGEDVYSLVVFNSQSQIVFQRLLKKAAATMMKKVGAKVNPKSETKFQSVFQALYKLLSQSAVPEDVRVVFLSDGKPYEKRTVLTLFDKQLLQKHRANSFELHAVAFGSSEHWHHLRSLAEVTGGTFQTSSMEQLQLHQAFTSIAATITSSSGDRSATLRSAALDIPFDPLCRETKCKRRCRLIQQRHKKKNKWTYVDEEMVLAEVVSVTVDMKPFNFGGMRLVFGMWDASTKNSQHPMVAKRLIQKPHADKEEMLHFCRCTSIAIELRESFKQALKKVNVEISIWFVPCYLYEYESGCGISYFVGEQRLEGHFVKFNGNNGYVNEEAKLETETEILQALSHYSYFRSKGSILLIDLQGVIDNGWVLLTDPQLHSRTKKYGRADLGLEGIKSFFESHQCGPTCEKLQLQEQTTELLRQLQLERDRRCQVCMNAASKTVLEPCGHSAICRTCALQLLESNSALCPLCRKPFQRWRDGIFSSTYVPTVRRH